MKGAQEEFDMGRERIAIGQLYSERERKAKVAVRRSVCGANERWASELIGLNPLHPVFGGALKKVGVKFEEGSARIGAPSLSAPSFSGLLHAPALPTFTSLQGSLLLPRNIPYSSHPSAQSFTSPYYQNQHPAFAIDLAYPFHFFHSLHYHIHECRPRNFGREGITNTTKLTVQGFPDGWQSSAELSEEEYVGRRRAEYETLEGIPEETPGEALEETSSLRCPGGPALDPTPTICGEQPRHAALDHGGGGWCGLQSWDEDRGVGLS
ncbi:hypothetical protein BCR34DRAFT_641327 [Clohesyomyces aquaticus]|uniref:Uncharacterized protein n=1 Tax=Clohesyomyces aquaticus TaxID=1231657 RepID=A0A1Y1YJ79_9PLEO|nr:hypothetical protein BCR34DRAFT_641327 [Clohesyomyces aquaticus]